MNCGGGSANEGQLFLVENGPAGENRSVEYEGTAKQQSLLMTIDELWRCLTVDDFVSTLECHCTDGWLRIDKRIKN